MRKALALDIVSISSCQGLLYLRVFIRMRSACIVLEGILEADQSFVEMRLISLVCSRKVYHHQYVTQIMLDFGIAKWVAFARIGMEDILQDRNALFLY